MSANNPATPDKSKQRLLIIVGLVAVLVLGGGGVAWFMSSRGGDDESGGSSARRDTSKLAPVFLPIETMVVNLADPGGDRFVQLGITVEVDDAKTSDLVKQYLPAIRSGIILLVSQRTSGELLQRAGKEKLANDILREVSRPLGYSVPSERSRAARDEEMDEEEDDDRPRRRARGPVRRVLFSSFIIQ